MKIKIYFFILILVSISCKRGDKTTIINPAEEATFESVKEGKHCFKLVLENLVKKGKETVIQEDYLNITLNINGTNANGEYNFISTKNLSSEGNFVGTIANNIISAIHTYTQNDKKSKEEIVLKIEKNQISLLGGEKIKKEDTFIFKDKSQGTYMIQIPRVNCN